jgi:hypothetical protein
MQIEGLPAEGTSSFTSAFRSGGATAPFPVRFQQITDNQFSCQVWRNLSLNSDEC